MHNLDDYGWYEVGGQRFYNKIQAVMEANRRGLPLRWDINDHILDQYKWDQEPQESLADLYARRAQGIRDKYDYLVLHFSGGSDSGNILETFIRNKIHLDEILVRGSYSVTTPKTGKVTAVENYSECLAQSIPLAQWAKDTHMPHVKIRLVDTVPIMQNFYSTNTDWIEKGYTALSPSLILRGNLDLLHEDYGHMADKGIKVAHILGIDKPHIYRKKNYFYHRCYDQHEMDWLAVPYSISYRPQFTELFYWGINAVTMRIKQLHLLKNEIKRTNAPDSTFDYRRGRPYERWASSIIYSRTLPLITEHEKDITTTILKDRDWYFAKDIHSTAFINYSRGVQLLSQEIKKDWWHGQETFWRKGLKIMHSKPRFLGT